MSPCHYWTCVTTHHQLRVCIFFISSVLCAAEYRLCIGKDRKGHLPNIQFLLLFLGANGARESCSVELIETQSGQCGSENASRSLTPSPQNPAVMTWHFHAFNWWTIFCTYSLPHRLKGTNAFVYIPIKRRLFNCPDSLMVAVHVRLNGLSSDCIHQLCIYCFSWGWRQKQQSTMPSTMTFYLLVPWCLCLAAASCGSVLFHILYDVYTVYIVISSSSLLSLSLSLSAGCWCLSS